MLSQNPYKSWTVLTSKLILKTKAKPIWNIQDFQVLSATDNVHFMYLMLRLYVPKMYFVLCALRGVICQFYVHCI